ncbi:TPA: hypothetical protein DCZ39_07545 [Patescibacteria group bacterium]|nr:hypothetical protein [Candidatus Gracilibacteria bacterium]
MGINQIDKQYRAVTEEIFNLNTISQTEAIDREIFRSKIQKNIDAKKTDKMYGAFVTNNEQYFTDNLNFILRYMDANKFF